MGSHGSKRDELGGCPLPAGLFGVAARVQPKARSFESFLVKAKNLSLWFS